MPHLDLPRTLALGLAQAVRAAILALAAVATWRWLRKADPAAPLTLVMLTALWTATLYLVLPETKARYAVYTAPAYLPILAALATAARREHYRATALLIILVAASLAALIDLPRPLLHLGAGLAGPLILFIATLALMKRTDWLTHEHHE